MDDREIEYVLEVGLEEFGYPYFVPYVNNGMDYSKKIKANMNCPGILIGINHVEDDYGKNSKVRKWMKENEGWEEQYFPLP
jgi:hypothetical protein